MSRLEYKYKQNATKCRQLGQEIERLVRLSKQHTAAGEWDKVLQLQRRKLWLRKELEALFDEQLDLYDQIHNPPESTNTARRKQEKAIPYMRPLNRKVPWSRLKGKA